MNHVERFRAVMKGPMIGETLFAEFVAPYYRRLLPRVKEMGAVTIVDTDGNVTLAGHYDKMVLPNGEAAMREEFERLAPLMKTGRFIPSVDHQTPPGVSLEQYGTYLHLLNEYNVYT